MEDESRMAELNKKAMELVQDQRCVLEYANELTSIWNESECYRPLPTDISREYILKGRNYRFLIGLHSELEAVRSLLFNREKQLSFDEAVVQVVREEGRLLSLGILTQPESKVSIATTNISLTQRPQTNIDGPIQAFHLKQLENQTSSTKKTISKKKGDAKDALWCDFYKRHRHTRETC